MDEGRTMLHRWRFWIGLAVLAVCLGVVGMQFVRQPAPIRIYHRIKLGMNPAQVTDTIGMPPRVVTYPLLEAWCWNDCWDMVRETGVSHQSLRGQGPSRFVVQEWSFGDYLLWVAFENDSAVGLYLLKEDGDCPVHTTLIERFRAFVGL
jgi:hypothetical protein